jgi:hypothetical protein
VLIGGVGGTRGPDSRRAFLRACPTTWRASSAARSAGDLSEQRSFAERLVQAIERCGREHDLRHAFAVAFRGLGSEESAKGLRAGEVSYTSWPWPVETTSVSLSLTYVGHVIFGAWLTALHRFMSAT